jgi:hypothetical protein
MWTDIEALPFGSIASGRRAKLSHLDQSLLAQTSQFQVDTLPIHLASSFVEQPTPGGGRLHNSPFVSDGALELVSRNEGKKDS